HTRFSRDWSSDVCSSDLIAVVITLSAVYATQAMGFSMSQTMMLVFTVNIAAAVGAMGFGHVQDNLGHKPALAITLCGWLLMIVLDRKSTRLNSSHVKISY